MSDREYFLKFIKKGNFNIDEIEKIKKTLMLTDTQLIRKTFKVLFNEIDYTNISTAYIDMITNSTNLLYFICNTTNFNEESIIINRKRIKKAREALLNQASNINNQQLLDAANRLDEIVLGKSIELKDLNKLLKKLIDKKEDINIIKKILGTNKGVLAFENNELFDYVFNKSLVSLEYNNADIYYYIALLKIFYSSKIDKYKYLMKLTNLNEETKDFEEEIYNIIHGKRRPLNKEEVLDKYCIIRDFETKNIIPNIYQTKEDTIFTLDSDGALIRDDALSIKIENNNYVVGIYISDPGRFIEPNSNIDFQAKNNFTCAYMPNYCTKILPNNIEKEFSLDKGQIRNVLALYVTISNKGEILNYYLTKEIVKINENYYFSEADKKLTNVNDKITYKLNQLYELAGLLQYKNAKKYSYWHKKENDSLDKEIMPNRSNKIVNELMVLYNSLLATIACENSIPYVYRTQNNSYLENLVRRMDIPLDEETDKILKSIYLKSKYSIIPIFHSGLNLRSYSHSTCALRRYPDLYNQLLIHNFYFKDINMDFDEKYHENLVNYFNQRSTEIDLMKAEYIRALKPKES